jgi:hypothetical protein
MEIGEQWSDMVWHGLTWSDMSDVVWLSYTELQYAITCYNMLQYYPMLQDLQSARINIAYDCFEMFRDASDIFGHLGYLSVCMCRVSDGFGMFRYVSVYSGYSGLEGALVCDFTPTT